MAGGDPTVLWTQVATLLTLAWALGALARRCGQPPIIGSLVAGLLAGPSVFGHLAPRAFHWFHPVAATNGGLLSGVANFSLLLLLIALGAETDLQLIRRSGRRAATVVGSSLALPMAAGVGVALLLPLTFLGRHHDRGPFVLLMAAAMTVSSLPVIARIVTEMGISRRDVGQLSFAAASVNDAFGLMILAIATSLVDGGGTSKLLVVIGGLVLLVVVSATGGQKGLDLVLRRSRRDGPNIASALSASVVFTFVVAAVAQALGVDAALGAFLAGIVVGRSPYTPRRALDTVNWASNAVFAPLYFATAGLSVDVGLLGRDSTGWWFLAILGVAIGAKLLGVTVGARFAGVSGRDAFALGISLNGRGALQVIIATAGLTAGIISRAAFTVIIMLSIVSSVAVPPALRRVFRDWHGTEDERKRLTHEDEMASNVIVRGQRVLLPTRGTPNSVAAARILDLAWPAESEVTLLHLMTGPRSDDGIDHVRNMLTSREVNEKFADDDQADAVAAVLAEANLGYGMIAIGAADQPTQGRPLPPVIEQLLNLSPIALLVTRRGSATTATDGCPVIRPRRILVPVTGSAASRAGVEVAQMIGRNTGAHVSLMHVITRPDTGPGDSTDEGKRTGQALITEARRGVSGDLSVDTVTATATSAGDEICAEASARSADIVVLGTTVRRVDDRPFLGHTVDHLLAELTEPTIVVAVIPDAQQAAIEEHVDRGAG